MHEQRSSMSPNDFSLNSPFLLPLDSPSHITSPPTQGQPGLLGPQHTGAFALTTSPDPDSRNGMLGTSTEFGENPSPDTARSLAPMNGLVPITSAPMQGLVSIPSFGYQEPLYSPTIDNTISTIAKGGPEENDEIEEVIRSNHNSQSDWMISALSPAYANSSRSRSSRGEVFISASDIFRRPVVTAASPEMLVLHFDKHTCGIMSVKDGPNENPWRTLIWPLAQDSPALYHAIASMTAFHMSGGKPELRELRVEGMEHMRSSIHCLANDIRNGNTHNEAALATTLVLAFSEAFDRHTSTGIEHLRGAKVLVRRALDEQSTSRPDKVAYKRLGFLYNVWVYLDVLARLTSDEDDDEGPGFVVNRPLTPISEIDPLLGCAATLFPLIGRVANLVQKVRKADQNTCDIISEGMGIKDLLEGWAPESRYETPEDISSDVGHCVQTAEAYRYATLLYLHQAVPELPSPGSRELARRVMQLIAQIPLTSRSCIVHIYPLLAAGCEAVTERERSWVKSRWEGMCSRMWIGNVSKAWEVMEEVWERRDKFRESQEAMQRYPLSPADARFCSPTLDAPVYKREVNPVGSEVEEVYGWGRAVLSENSDMRLKGQAMIDRSSGGNTPSEILAEYEMSVRGKLHWVGVMRDWNWEGEHPEQSTARFCLRLTFGE